MFGRGKQKRQFRNETFGPSRLRSAALVGLGMMAWKWWRNRQAGESRNPTQRRPLYDTTAGPGGSV
jgi:hypothetical protein